MRRGASRRVLKRPGIEFLDQLANRLIGFFERRERPMPKTEQDPPLNQQHAVFSWRFILRFTRPRRKEHRAIVSRHIEVREVDFRIGEAGFGHTGFQVVADHHLGHAAERREHMGMRGNPIGQILMPDRFGVGVERSP